jgi:cation diffusion facilitator CzcD-associated flavoprotein CzcO
MSSVRFEEQAHDPETTCVIGAGSSGLTAVKALVDAGLPCHAFEESDRPGGLWVFQNPNKKSAAYRSLSINTSRERMQFRDFPMPRSYPDYPGHQRIAEYFAEYADHFRLHEHIRYRVRVERVVPAKDRGFDVSTSDGRARRYRAVVVANGHHWDPALPDPPFEGRFAGTAIHSSAYVDPKTPLDLVGKRVVVVGFGNSAVDIACELAAPGVAARVVLSTRRGAWVLPKYVFGRPLDQLGIIPLFLPVRARQALGALLYRLVLGSPESVGLPRPDHLIGGAHPTISSDLFRLMKARRITRRPNVARLREREVEFTDGTREPADAIVYATGYRVTFPFFDESFVSAPKNDLPLYFRTFHPDIAGLYFVGLAQPLGAIMPIAEAQSKLIADHLAGRYEAPSPDRMRQSANDERRALALRYVPSPRHTMQVDFDDFMKALAKEHARGRKRAKRARA